MDIILLKDIDKLGYKHDIVAVKNGYGRNYLIPQGLGVIANPANMKKLESIKAEEEAKEAARVEEYRELITKLADATLKVGVKAGANGKIFGSVTNVQIAQALKEQYEVDIERRKIEVPEEVKELGTYSATLNLYTDIVGEVRFELVEE
ncbi:MAG: 50S ribosomal protein L9 [Saprospiraceae bacterium]|nr:50S ribosomal protein L9 [Saprospiraceae bacterium]